MITNNLATTALNCSVDGQNIVGTFTDARGGVGIYTSGNASGTDNTMYYTNPTLWDYWQNIYYPQIIRESYPIYIQEKAMDKGKQAFELVKALMDKKLLNVEKVKDFVEAMDTILKNL